LSNLLVRKNNQKVIVNNRYTYQYDKDSVEPIDGIYSVEASNSIGRWILQKPTNLYASDFAKTSAQSQESQSVKLQQTNDVAVKLGVPFIVDAEFMVLPVENVQGICFSVRSNNDITFTPKGKFKIVPNNLETYSIVHVENIENYKLVFPRVQGDRD
ncbi:hypothetical protein IAG11_23295, partial [Acinetobacter baumannii]|nr:hypothetical protein [Acinetobacter baumannii]